MARIVLKTLNRKNKFLYGQSRSLSYPIKILSYPILSPRLWNTGLVSSGANLASWGEGASLALVDNPSRDGVTIKVPYPPRLWNTGLVSSRDILTSWGEGAFLALVGHPSSDGITIKMPYGVDVLHRPASHPIFSYCVG